MTYLLAMMAALFWGLTAFAGNETGNGGDAIVCRDRKGKIRSAELLDLYEAREVRKIPVDLGPSHLSIEDKLEIALRRLERLSPNRVLKYRKWVKDFGREALFKSGITLTDIPDSGHVFVPVGCKIEQLVTQKEPTYEEDKRYIVNKDIWSKMSRDSKAAMVLHEVIYREAIFYHQKNSIATRYLNSYIASPKFEILGMKNFMKLLQTLYFEDLGWPAQLPVAIGRNRETGNGYEYHEMSVFFDSSGTVIGEFCPKEREVVFDRAQGFVMDPILLECFRIKYANGVPRELYFDGQTFLLENKYLMAGRQCSRILLGPGLRIEEFQQAPFKCRAAINNSLSHFGLIEGQWTKRWLVLLRPTPESDCKDLGRLLINDDGSIKSAEGCHRIQDYYPESSF